MIALQELTLIPMKLHSESMPSLRAWHAPSKTPASHCAGCRPAAACPSADGLACTCAHGPGTPIRTARVAVSFWEPYGKACVATGTRSRHSTVSCGPSSLQQKHHEACSKWLRHKAICKRHCPKSRTDTHREPDQRCRRAIVAVRSVDGMAAIAWLHVSATRAAAISASRGLREPHTQ